MIVHVLGWTRRDQVEHMIFRVIRVSNDATEPVRAEQTPSIGTLLKVPVLQ